MNEKEYEISTDKNRIDLAMIHDFLANESYWAKGIPLDVMKKSIENSLCFGVYHQGRQVGFARVVTDYATIAYLGDVFIIEPYRGRGLGKRLIETIIDHSELKGLRLWFLGTRDAHDLYRRYGFKKVAETPAVERFMTILNPDVYKRQESEYFLQEVERKMQHEILPFSGKRRYATMDESNLRRICDGIERGNTHL